MVAKLALLVASVLLTLALFEAGIRVGVVPLPDHVVSDAWWKEHWLRERRGGNPREFVELDPLLGWIPAANLDGVDYEGVRIHTTSAHARGRREVPRERTGAARIVAVGDSYTFGQCVEDEETWPAVTGQLLADTEVLNLGVMGYGQGQALLRMRRDGLAYRPDAVVFGFHPSNVRRNPLRFRDYAKPRFRQTDAGLVLENVPVPPPQEIDRLWPPRLWNYVEILRDSRRYARAEVVRARLRLSAAIVRRMAEEARGAGARLVVVFLPHPSHLENAGPFGWRWLAKLCAEDEEFVCVDPLPRMRERLAGEADSKAHFACHYSPALQRAVGEAVAETLRALDPARFAPRRDPDAGP